ncbi:MAG: M28 family peptidase [Paludibacteraceae bacterium]|nr:M28 family peptidase [Paludibacteraceae bacterium]
MNFSKKTAFLMLTASIFGLTACGAKKQKQEPIAKDSVAISIPKFDADSAYKYVKTQVDFGPRVPNSKAHESCGDYLIKEMTRFGAKVTVQATNLVGYDGKNLKARNIIASFNLEKATRVLFLAHWDCRPWSDHDPNPANQKKPVDGANDAASGVGVLMEMARQLNKQKPEVGVDIVFVDMEDYGEPDWYKGEKKEESWCLGTQYWARNPHVPGYHARYGILLDMVGAPNAVFPKEGYSLQYASYVIDNIWNEAQAQGFGNYFVNKQGGFITDDHVPVNQIIGIPTVDIIHFTENGFGSYWHTQDDTMKNIDKNTLHAVGQTLLAVIYKEKE